MSLLLTNTKYQETIANSSICLLLLLLLAFLLLLFPHALRFVKGGVNKSITEIRSTV